MYVRYVKCKLNLWIAADWGSCWNLLFNPNIYLYIYRERECSRIGIYHVSNCASKKLK